MKRKYIIIFIVAILAVSGSLYSALKPEPKYEPEKMIPVEDARVIKMTETVLTTARRLASQRTPQGLYRISVPESGFFMEESFESLKALERRGLKVESLSHSEKNPSSYVCKVSNAAGQKGNMKLYSPNGRQWAFVAFKMEEQESEG